MLDEIKIVGTIKKTIKYLNGTKKVVYFKNKTLQTGKAVFAATLANKLEKPLYIAKMLFGEKGITKVNKPVKGTIISPTIVEFSATIEFDEANDSLINEMSLELNNGELFSTSTFKDTHKTKDIELDYLWQISFV